jgi:hypothetical protein
VQLLLKGNSIDDTARQKSTEPSMIVLLIVTRWLYTLAIAFPSKILHDKETTSAPLPVEKKEGMVQQSYPKCTKTMLE